MAFLSPPALRFLVKIYGCQSAAAASVRSKLLASSAARNRKFVTAGYLCAKDSNFTM